MCLAYRMQRVDMQGMWGQGVRARRALQRIFSKGLHYYMKQGGKPWQTEEHAKGGRTCRRVVTPKPQRRGKLEPRAPQIPSTRMQVNSGTDACQNWPARGDPQAPEARQARTPSPLIPNGGSPTLQWRWVVEATGVGFLPRGQGRSSRARGCRGCERRGPFLENVFRRAVFEPGGLCSPQ